LIIPWSVGKMNSSGRKGNSLIQLYICQHKLNLSSCSSHAWKNRQHGEDWLIDWLIIPLFVGKMNSSRRKGNSLIQLYICQHKLFMNLSSGWCCFSKMWILGTDFNLQREGVY
jgi:hypothetical protein